MKDALAMLKKRAKKIEREIQIRKYKAPTLELIMEIINRDNLELKKHMGNDWDDSLVHVTPEPQALLAKLSDADIGKGFVEKVLLIAEEELLRRTLALINEESKCNIENN